MNQKIQLKHPAGKKAVSMDKVKYDTLKKAILQCLKINGELSHTEMLKTITEDFKKKKIKFEGSIEWHMEWVKLDLEAKKEITKHADKPTVKYTIA